MATDQVRVQAELELMKAIEVAFGIPAQQTNPKSEYAKLGCTLIAMLPNEAMFAFGTLPTAWEKLVKHLKKLKQTHDEIGAKYGLTPIGDGFKAAAGGALVLYIGFETAYAQSLQPSSAPVA
jgi:hypothetical protein